MTRTQKTRNSEALITPVMAWSALGSFDEQGFAKQVAKNLQEREPVLRQAVHAEIDGALGRMALYLD